MVTFYKLTHGIMTIDNNLIQSSLNNNRRESRSSNPNHLSIKDHYLHNARPLPAQCKTTTYQRSFLNRTKRLWNVLPKSLTSNNISLGQFKNGLSKYYKLALEDVFDVDDPRTWKSICLSCNKSRNICPVKYRVVIRFVLLYSISIVHGAAVIGENCCVHPANGTHIICCCSILLGKVK